MFLKLLLNRSVIEHTRDLDPTRPVTFVGNQMWLDDKAVSFSVTLKNLFSNFESFIFLQC